MAESLFLNWFLFALPMEKLQSITLRGFQSDNIGWLCAPALDNLNELRLQPTTWGFITSTRLKVEKNFKFFFHTHPELKTFICEGNLVAPSYFKVLLDLVPNKIENIGIISSKFEFLNKLNCLKHFEVDLYDSFANLYKSLQYLPAKNMLESVKIYTCPNDGSQLRVGNWPELMEEFRNLRYFHIVVADNAFAYEGDMIEFLPNLVNVTKFTISNVCTFNIDLVIEIPKLIKNLRVLEIIVHEFMEYEKKIELLQKIYLGLISVCRNAEKSKGPLIVYYKNRKVVEDCRKILRKNYNESVVALKWNIQQSF